MQALAIFLSSATAMLKLQIIIVCGVLLAMAGILTPTIAKGINQMTFTLLIPCLLFSKVASSMSLQALKSLFIVALFAFINIFSGFAAGYIGWPIMRLLMSCFSPTSDLPPDESAIEMLSMEDRLEDSNQELVAMEDRTAVESKDIADDNVSSGRHRVIAAVAFGNATSLPLGLITGIYPAKAYGEELALAMSYVAIYLSISQVLMYSLGYSFLSQGSTESQQVSWKESFIRSSKKLLTPPTFALAIGCFVSLVPPVKRLMYYDGGEAIFPGYPSISPPLSVLVSAIDTLADASVPMILLVLGANLSKGPGGSVSRANVALTLFLKLIVCPLWGIVCVGIANFMGFIANSTMYLVLLINTATPTAVTLVVITSILNQGEEQMSAILFYQYIVSIPTLTLFLVIFFYITGSTVQ